MSHRRPSSSKNRRVTGPVTVRAEDLAGLQAFYESLVDEGALTPAEADQIVARHRADAEAFAADRSSDAGQEAP